MADGYFLANSIKPGDPDRDLGGGPASRANPIPARTRTKDVRGLVSLCVRRYGIVTALSAVALILGCWGAVRSPLDVFPEFVPSQVDIQTEAPGFSPQQVEELVTKRIESAVNGAGRLNHDAFRIDPGLVGRHHHVYRQRRCPRCAPGNFREAVRNRQHSTRRSGDAEVSRPWCRAPWTFSR